MSVKCEICGNDFGRITALHLWKIHKITMKEYRRQYPFSKIVSDDDKTISIMENEFSGYPKG